MHTELQRVKYSEMTVIMDNTCIVNIIAELCILPKRTRNVNAFTTTPQEHWSYHITWREKEREIYLSVQLFTCVFEMPVVICACAIWFYA